VGKKIQIRGSPIPRTPGRRKETDPEKAVLGRAVGETDWPLSVKKEKKEKKDTESSM